MDSNLKKTKWHRLVSRGRHHAVLFIDSVDDGNQKEYLRERLGVDYVFEGYRQFDGSRWITEKDYRKISKILQEKTKRNPEFLFFWANYFEKSAQNIILETDKYKKIDWKKESDFEILKTLEIFFQLISLMWCGPMIYTWYFFFNDRKLEELKVKLEDKYKDKFDILWQYIIQPEKLTLAGEEKLVLLELAKKFRKNGVNEKDLREHVEKFAYLNKYIFWGDGMALGDVKRKIKVLMKKNISGIDKEIGSFSKKRINLKKYNLSREEKDWIKGFKKMAYTINLSDESCNYFAYYLKPMLEELAGRLRINYEQLVSMTLNEIKISIKKNKSYISKKELSSRLRDHALIYFKNKTYIFTGSKLGAYKKIELKKELKLRRGKNERIAGTVAYGGGKITGKIRIIRDISEIASFKKGEILVTQMTNPTYLPAMQKAGAIVTDEGGILCHAAVVARELRIPCIIGTKIATKVFKNGDLVEVDAAKGIIRKLK